MLEKVNAHVLHHLILSSQTSSNHTHLFHQVVCLWPSRGRPRLTSAVWTTRTVPAPCPTCLCCLETTASWSNTTTSTSQEVPFLPGLLVPVSVLSVPVEPVHGSSLSQLNQLFSVSGDDSMRMSHLKVGSAADIPLDIGELDLTQLTASLTTPSGREEPCLLKMLRNGHVGRRPSVPGWSWGL